MDWLYSKTAGIGQWALTYPLALISIAAGVFIVYVIIAVIKESEVEHESLLVDSRGEPLRITAISRKKAFRFVGAIAVCILLVGYGTYRYYRTSDAALLARYPLGYVIFNVHSAKGIFPYPPRGDLSNLVLDWRSVKAVEGPRNTIGITMPDVYRANGSPLAIDITMLGDKKVGPFPMAGSALFGTPDFTEYAEILAINRNGVVFLIGLRPTPRHPPSAAYIQDLGKQLASGSYLEKDRGSYDY